MLLAAMGNATLSSPRLNKISNVANFPLAAKKGRKN
jgi:hypothetical protein